MRFMYFDCETLSRPEAELLPLMPEDIANAVMPEEFNYCPMISIQESPKYGGDAAKQQAWLEAETKKVTAKWQKAREDWRIKIIEAKMRWFADAALHAERATVKLMTFRASGKTRCIVIDATMEEIEKIKAHKDWPFPVAFTFLSEKQALEYFANEALQWGKAFSLKACGFFIKGFDLPFLIRRQFIQGVAPSLDLLRNSSHFDDDCCLDLHELWQMGDRQRNCGGLRGLSKILGVEVKEGDGENFGRLWKENPVLAITYNLKEVGVLEAVAKKMGIS